jgi:hypothetical protein
MSRQMPSLKRPAVTRWLLWQDYREEYRAFGPLYVYPNGPFVCHRSPCRLAHWRTWVPTDAYAQWLRGR